MNTILRRRALSVAAAGFLALGGVACQDDVDNPTQQEEAEEDNENVGDAPGEQDPLGASPTEEDAEEE